MLGVPLNREPLLTPDEIRSHESFASAAAGDGASLAFSVCIENLTPERASTSGHVLDVTPSQTIGELKRLYLAKLVADAAAAPALSHSAARGSSFRAEEVRLIFDGAELADDATIESTGLRPGARLAALRIRQRRGCLGCVLRSVHRWWPLLLHPVLFSLLLCEAYGILPPIGGGSWGGTGSPSRDTLAHEELLLLYLDVSAPLLLPYAFVASGLFQEDRGRRLLWFLRLHMTAAAISFAVAIAALIWFCVGAIWLFGTCRDASPHVYFPALTAWLLLLLVNAPVFIVLVLPCLLFSQCQIAFTIVAFLSGAQLGARQR